MDRRSVEMERWEKFQEISLKAARKLAPVFLVLGTLFSGLLIGYLISEVHNQKQLKFLVGYEPTPPTRLYDREGRVFAELYRQRQELIPFQTIPPHVVHAFLSTEDDNFFHHFGIDIPGIIRAALKNLLAGRVVQGGSTLTQQLAKQLILDAEGSRDRTFDQKIRETVLALQLEEELSKEEILEVYFNIIYLGHGCQGLACASQIFFKEKVEDLTLPQGAVLARMPKAPVDYSPFRNPRKAMEQHRVILSLMADDGIISDKDIDSIHKNFWMKYWEQVVVEYPGQTTWGQKLYKAPYFTEYVRQILEANPSIGEEKLYGEGLRVYTTLDLVQQEVAESEIQKSLRRVNVGNPIMRQDVWGYTAKDPRSLFRKDLEDSDDLDALQILGYVTPNWNPAAALEEFRARSVNYRTNTQVQAAYISIHPSTGYITAMVGGADFSPRNQFNRALLAKRQPGSSFKIFVYGAAIEQRSINTSSGLNDLPFAIISRTGRVWDPSNYGEGFSGIVPAKRALALSLNTCAVQTFFRVGAEPVIDLASRTMKIRDRSRFNPDPAMALGASEVTPMEMAQALAVIANNGKDVIPFAIRYVTDNDGNVLYNKEAAIRKIIAIKTQTGQIQLMEPALAYIMRDMMEEVANGGTAQAGLRTYQHDGGSFQGEFAAKTGTTQQWSDAWLVGFNPDFAQAIWFGYDQGKFSMGGQWAGGSLAAPTVGRIMSGYYERARRNPPKFDRDRPDGIVGADCNGMALAPIEVDGEKIEAPEEGVCADDPNLKIYDQRELIMKELGITKEDLGVEEWERLRFKYENLDDKRKERERRIKQEKYGIPSGEDSQGEPENQNPDNE